MKLTLEAARRNKGFTQEQAAIKIGVSRYTIANWEAGKSYPDVPYLMRIEEIYGVPYSGIIFCPETTDKP